MNAWLITFGIIWIIYFVLFGMQRTALMISRKAGIEWKVGGELLLPSWYPVTWVITIGKWVLLIAMAIIWDWRYALSLAIGGFLLSALLPIPYSAYKGVFRKRVNRLMHQEHTMAVQLQKMLDEVTF